VRNADISRTTQWTVNKKGAFDENRYILVSAGRFCGKIIKGGRVESSPKTGSFRLKSA
jgi:hypothetical protein